MNNMHVALCALVALIAASAVHADDTKFSADADGLHAGALAVADPV